MQNDTIFEYLASHREAMLSDLATLVAIPSVRGDGEEGMPFGREVDAALRAAEALFAREGFATERDPLGRYALVHFGEGEREIALLAHLDVVPAGEGWTLTAPFVPRLVDGCLVGRGAHDNKGGVVASLYLLMALRDLGLAPACRVTVFLGAAEETGMEDAHAFAERTPLPNVALVPDNDPPLSIGEKGRVTAWLVSPAELSTVREITGGTAYNVVLDTATARLLYSEALLAELSAAVAEREDMTLTAVPDAGELTLTCRGIAAHASHPDGSRNAAAELCALLASCSTLSFDERGVLAAAALFTKDPHGGTLGIAGEDGPFGRRTAVCGMVRTQASRLFLSEDIRFGVPFSTLSDDLFEGVDGEDYELCLTSCDEPFDHGDGDPLAARLMDAFRRLTGDTAATPYRSGGGTYARCLPRAYSCGLLYRETGDASPLALPAGHGDPHTPDEYVSGEELVRGTRILAEYLLTAAAYLANE
ncbi:MAG: Sapep family Mn(2+)-dependent dipeptidase [Clostridia bacterium]|nr:Sapep family Mn(2+)-dependent dipeptidase [Clostridia bacterium]